MSTKGDKDWVQQSRKSLDGAVHELSAEQRSKLAAAQASVLEDQSTSRRTPLVWLAPAATAALVLLLVIRPSSDAPGQMDNSQTPAEVTISDIEEDEQMLLAQTDPELLEDLEFLLWLDTTDVLADQDG